MTTYTVAFAHPNIADTRLTAVDSFDLGEQVAAYLARRKALRPGHYDAVIGGSSGQIKQHLLPRPITFTIRKDS